MLRPVAAATGIGGVGFASLSASSGSEVEVGGRFAGLTVIDRDGSPEGSTWRIGHKPDQRD